MRPRGSRSGLLLALALLVAGTGSAVAAESVWNMEGLGRPLEPYDHAARGAGSTAIAIEDPYGMSFVNPAAIANAARPQAAFGLLNQNRWIRAGGDDGSGRRFDARMTHARVVVPGPGPIRWGIGLSDLTDGTYRVRFRLNRGREDEFVRTLTGRGGVSAISLALAARLAGGRIAAGAELGLANGTLRDEVEDAFSGSRYLNTKSTLRTRVENGRVLGIGVQARLGSGVFAGACYRAAAGVDLKGIWRISSGSEWQETAGFELPASVGVGLAWRARPRLRFAADWNRSAWGAVKLRLRSSEQLDEPTPESGRGGFGALRDTDRLGVGVSILPSSEDARTPLLRRSVWRLGATWGELPVVQRGSGDAAGEQVTEWALTAGCGLPVQADRGFLDLFLEGGSTGDLGAIGLRETFLRLGAGISFGRLPEKF
jgi:hypothetical protein